MKNYSILLFFMEKNYFVIGVRCWSITVSFTEMQMVLFLWLLSNTASICPDSAGCQWSTGFGRKVSAAG